MQPQNCLSSVVSNGFYADIAPDMSVSEGYGMAYLLGQKTAKKKEGKIQQLTSITVKPKENETVTGKEKSPQKSTPKDAAGPQQKITSNSHSRGSSEKTTSESDSSEDENEQDNGRVTSSSPLTSPLTNKENTGRTSPTSVVDRGRQSSKLPEGRPGEFTCSQCGKILLKYWELQRHKMEDHTPKPGFLKPQFLCPVEGCPSKDGGYPRKVWLDQHMKKWHPEHEHEYSDSSEERDETDNSAHHQKNKGEQEEVEVVVVDSDSESESGDQGLPHDNATLAPGGDRVEDEVDLLILPDESHIAEDNSADRRPKIDRELSEIAGNDIETPPDTTLVVINPDTTSHPSKERDLPEPTPQRPRALSIESQRQEPGLVVGSPIPSRGTVSPQRQAIPNQQETGGGSPSHPPKAFTQQRFQQTSPVEQLQAPVTPLRLHPELLASLVNSIQQKYPGTVIQQSVTPAWGAPTQLRQQRPMMNPSELSTQLPPDNPIEKSTRPRMQITRYPPPPHLTSYPCYPSPYSPSPYYQPFSAGQHQYQFPMLYPLPPRPPQPVIQSGGHVQQPGEPGAIFHSGNPRSTPTSPLPPPPFPQAKSPESGPSQLQLQQQPQPPTHPSEQPSQQPSPQQPQESQPQPQPSQQLSQQPQESPPQPSPQPSRQPTPQPQPASQAQKVNLEADSDHDNDNDNDVQVQIQIHSPATRARVTPQRPKRSRPQEDLHFDDSEETDLIISRSRKRRSVDRSSASPSVLKFPLEAQDARDAMIETLLKENKALHAQLSDMRRLENDYLEISEELADIRARLERGGFRIVGKGDGERVQNDRAGGDRENDRDNSPG